MNVYLFSFFALVSVGRVDLDDIDEAVNTRDAIMVWPKKHGTPKGHTDTVKQSERHACLQEHSYSGVILLV